MRIQVAKQNPPALLKIEFDVPENTTIETVLKLLSINVDPGWSISVWGELQDLAHTLKEGDRIEISAPLLADPKVARRLRQERQERAKTTK